MEYPIAFKTRRGGALDVQRVSLNPTDMEKLRSRSAEAPAILVARRAAMIVGMQAGMVDPADVVALADGDWSNALLILLPDEVPNDAMQDVGDAAFIAQVEKNAPALAKLAAQTVAAIRKAGVQGELVEGGGGRWVNRPLNTFTLKSQPRVGNLAFTLYGNPETYEAGEFLLKDQNSYSRGWVKGPQDVARLAELAKQSHARRNG